MLTSDEIQMPEMPLLGEWHDFDPSPELPVLNHGGTPVAGIPKALREAVPLKQYKVFMCKKFDWSDATWNSIDWECFKAAMKK